ncbi:hypothetical protein M405DRAFT_886366 [Rhizopogon salebrosus TDB-379]|nr:hypothetical protein M405DRAFT_886366 [Rhizopogon salebrosus TDB-379]
MVKSSAGEIPSWPSSTLISKGKVSAATTVCITSKDPYVQHMTGEPPLQRLFLLIQLPDLAYSTPANFTGSIRLYLKICMLNEVEVNTSTRNLVLTGVIMMEYWNHKCSASVQRLGNIHLSGDSWGRTTLESRKRAYLFDGRGLLPGSARGTGAGRLPRSFFIMLLGFPIFKTALHVNVMQNVRLITAICRTL